MVNFSLIIPVLNEADFIQSSLQRLPLDHEVEILVVDGGSQDNTVALAQASGVKVLSSPQRGRANQMNWGAVNAIGEILIFLHADTRLPADCLLQIRSLLALPDVVAGAFRLKIEAQPMIYRWLEAAINLRSQLLSLPYGDQAIFLRADRFRAMGGFRDLPIMEDFEFIQRLKQEGKIAIATSAVITSPRRWQKLGILRTTLINQQIILGYALGISPQRLATWYRRS